MSEKLKLIILDWAGTTVDFGCFAPVDAFMEAFAKFGIQPTLEETRAPMGLPKRAHIERMLSGERISALWQEAHGRAFTQEDVCLIYAAFEPALFATLEGHTDVLPGAADAVAELRAMDMKIGSTTGYTRAMMEVVALAAAAKGYAPDSLVSPDETGGVGRPFPDMIWKNLEYHGLSDIHQAMKVGDTVADIEEGKNAGCITVGVIKGSSMLGLSLAEYERKTEAELSTLHEAVRRSYYEAGADAVLESIEALPELVQKINKEREAYV